MTKQHAKRNMCHAMERFAVANLPHVFTSLNSSRMADRICPCSKSDLLGSLRCFALMDGESWHRTNTRDASSREAVTMLSWPATRCLQTSIEIHLFAASLITPEGAGCPRAAVPWITPWHWPADKWVSVHVVAGTIGSAHGDGTACTGASIFRESGLIKAAFIDRSFSIPMVRRLLQTLFWKSATPLQLVPPKERREEDASKCYLMWLWGKAATVFARFLNRVSFFPSILWHAPVLLFEGDRPTALTKNITVNYLHLFCCLWLLAIIWHLAIINVYVTIIHL